MYYASRPSTFGSQSALGFSSLVLFEQVVVSAKEFQRGGVEQVGFLDVYRMPARQVRHLQAGQEFRGQLAHRLKPAFEAAVDEQGRHARS